MIGIIGRASTANHMSTVHEHVLALPHRRGRPITAGIDLRHGTTVIEHPTHVRHLRGIEVREINCLQ